MSKSTPPAPDYTQAAQAQSQGSQQLTEQQTVANRPDVNTPFGNESWQMTPTYDPVSGQYVSNWTQDVTLNPAQQSALTAQQGVQAGESNLAQSLLPLEASEEGKGFGNNMGIAATPGVTTNASTMPSPTSFAQNASNAAEQEFMNYNQPLQQQATSQLDTQLRNQGLVPGDQAYDTAMQNLTNSQSLQNNQAENQSILTGSQIGQQEAQTALAGQQQQFGQELSGAQYQGTASQAQLAEQMQEQGFTLNQIQSILNGQQVGMPSMPGFTTAQGAQAPQTLTAAEDQGNAMLQSFNAQQQNQAGLEEGIGSIAGAAALAFF